MTKNGSSRILVGGLRFAGLGSICLGCGKWPDRVRVRVRVRTRQQPNELKEQCSWKRCLQGINPCLLHIRTRTRTRTRSTQFALPKGFDPSPEIHYASKKVPLKSAMNPKNTDLFLGGY